MAGIHIAGGTGFSLSSQLMDIMRFTIKWMARSVALWLGVVVTLLYSTGALLREDIRTGFAMVIRSSEFFCIFSL